MGAPGFYSAFKATSQTVENRGFGLPHLHIKYVVQFAHLLYNLLHAPVVLDHQPHTAGIAVGLWRNQHAFKVVGTPGNRPQMCDMTPG